MTQGLDLWFEFPASPASGQAATVAGGLYSSRTQPPMVGGNSLERMDVVTQRHGLGSFKEEYDNTVALRISPSRAIS